MYVSMDTILGNTVVGNGLNGTIMGTTPTATDAMKGQSIRIYHEGTNDNYINFGQHAYKCVSDVNNCADHPDNTLTVALWVKLLTTVKSGVFTNTGGVRVYIDRDTNDNDVYFECLTQKYSVENIIVPDPAGWNHYIMMCSTNSTGHVIVNGKEWFGEISTASGTMGTSGKVTLGFSYTSSSNEFLADELKIWYSALDIISASALYNSDN